MRAVDIIMKKRDGGELSRDEIAAIVDGYVSGDIPEYQVSAWLMAVFFKGMSFRETADLTELMLRSGDSMDLSGLAGPFVDKHSTGGVGDKVSLPLAPIVAACGIKVPMMSGRALGHTGGTLDKLESIPGYTTRLDEARFRDYIERDGFAMTGQTDAIVPADKKLYSLRDVTATVESVPLITASILSKKVAEGAESLVFDVKCGPGAFMKTFEDAERLASSLVRTGQAMGKRVVGVISDMSEPLGMKVGNFLEVEESIDCLRGEGPADLMALTLRLASWMVVAGSAVVAGNAMAAASSDASAYAGRLAEAEALCSEAVSSGRALDLFLRNVKRQGGDVDAMMRMRGTFRSPHARELRAPSSGYVRSIDAFKIGLAGVYLGVGRNKTSDAVAPDVGFVFERKKGAKVEAGDLIATVYGKDARSLGDAWPLVEGALSLGPEAPAEGPLVLKEIAAI